MVKKSGFGASMRRNFFRPAAMQNRQDYPCGREAKEHLQDLIAAIEPSGAKR
jgi:endonuclease YncB( thermonuclease family)